MKNQPILPYIIIILGGSALHILLGLFVVEALIFGDSTATAFEQLMYQLAVLPPFLIAIFFYKETQKLGKSLEYSALFYVFSFMLVALYPSVPNKTEFIGGHQQTLGSYGFYVTGGGFGPTVIILHILLTVGILVTANKYLKSKH